MIRSAYFAAIADFCKQTFATQNFLMSQIFANIAILSKRKCGRVVECTGLENRRRLTPFVSSNLTASATMHNRTIRNRSFFISDRRFSLDWQAFQAFRPSGVIRHYAFVIGARMMDKMARSWIFRPFFNPTFMPRTITPLLVSQIKNLPEGKTVVVGGVTGYINLSCDSWSIVFC